MRIHNKLVMAQKIIILLSLIKGFNKCMIQELTAADTAISKPLATSES